MHSPKKQNIPRKFQIKVTYKFVGKAFMHKNPNISDRACLYWSFSTQMFITKILTLTS